MIDQIISHVLRMPTNVDHRELFDNRAEEKPDRVEVLRLPTASMDPLRLQARVCNDGSEQKFTDAHVQTLPLSTVSL